MSIQEFGQMIQNVNWAGNDSILGLHYIKDVYLILKIGYFSFRA